MTSNNGDKPKEPLFARRARVQRQLAQQRDALAIEWNALERAAYVQERRVVGITRGFRAVLPVGALAGVFWLVRRFGPARLAQPLLLGASAMSYVRRLLPWRHWHQHKDGQHATKWLPLAISLLGGYLKRRRDAHQRRDDAARTRAPAYRGGRRYGGLRRQS